MKLETAKAIAEAADDLGIEVRLRESYSGRGMYGKSTAGLEFDKLSDFVQAVAYASVAVREREDEEGALQHHHFLGDLRVGMDSMGLGFIVY